MLVTRRNFWTPCYPRVQIHCIVYFDLPVFFRNTPAPETTIGERITVCDFECSYYVGHSFAACGYLNPVFLRWILNRNIAPYCKIDSMVYHVIMKKNAFQWTARFWFINNKFLEAIGIIISECTVWLWWYSLHKFRPKKYYVTILISTLQDYVDDENGDEEEIPLSRPATSTTTTTTTTSTTTTPRPTTTSTTSTTTTTTTTTRRPDSTSHHEPRSSASQLSGYHHPPMSPHSAHKWQHLGSRESVKHTRNNVSLYRCECPFFSFFADTLIRFF